MKGEKAKSKDDYVCTIVHSPVGALKLVASEESLVAILWEDDDPRRVPLGTLHECKAADHPVLEEVSKQVTEYFAGTRKEFTVPVAFIGTAFQRNVWAALLTIPFGETRSYGDIARQLRRPRAVRAVGAANGRNPISIIAPCHRVIGSNGELTGFAGGMETKAYLLAHEGARPRLPGLVRPVSDEPRALERF